MQRSDQSQRFEIIHREGKRQKLQILRDRETGVCYLSQHLKYSGGGLTPLLDADSNVVVQHTASG